MRLPRFDASAASGVTIPQPSGKHKTTPRLWPGISDTQKYQKEYEQR